MNKQKFFSPRCACWHLLDENDAVIWAMSEAQLKSVRLVVTPDLPASRQWEIIGQMEISETVICKVLTPGYSVRPAFYTTHTLKRVA